VAVSTHVTQILKAGPLIHFSWKIHKAQNGLLGSTQNSHYITTKCTALNLYSSLLLITSLPATLAASSFTSPSTFNLSSSPAVASAASSSFSDFPDTFSWATSNASLNFCAPMTKQNHSKCDKGPVPKPNPPTTQYRPAHSLAEEINSKNSAFIEDNRISVPTNYLVLKTHSECRKKTVANSPLCS
jgi:hypothetical protein